MHPLPFAASLFALSLCLAVAQDPPPPAPRSPADEHTAAVAHQTAVFAQRAFVELAKKTLPSVVTVRAYGRKTTAAVAAGGPAAPGWVQAEAADYPGHELVAAGSGFFVDPTGDVLTCHHVLQKADGTLADLFDLELQDNSRVIAEVVGVEPTVNLAILHAMVFPNGHARDCKPLKFGDSDLLECGQWTLGFGDPAGPEKFFAVGSFIARPTRDCYQDHLSAFYLQTAMVAHPQAHGGPLVDLDGAVVGVLAPRKPTPGGVGTEPQFGIEYALPSKVVAGLYDAIRQARSFQSPWLGFSVMSRAEIATQRGLPAFQALNKPRAGILIENVWKPGPGANAGILPGDFLCAFDGTRIFTPVDFQKCLYLSGIGKTVKLELFRNGEGMHVEVAIERRPADATPR